MKSLLLPCLGILLFSACNNKPAATTPPKDTTTASIDLPYPINYSSDFEIADKKYVKSVLELWKDYQDNTLQNGLSKFADTVTFKTASGTVIKNTKDSVTAMVAAQRSKFSSVAHSIDVALALHPKGKDEIWVCVWGKEVDAMKDGKKDSVLLNENWMFDKNGKIAYLEQYAAKEVAKH
ncbi:MAG: hypothetical protein KGO81_08390 [Bacteroidota bacterium]|nr:hypothetical protein [Bacteroidota bacterium]